MAPHDRLLSDDALGGAGAPRVSIASAKSAAQSPRASAAHDGRWQDIYPNLTGPQRLELLALADQQGVVYAHQLPETRKNGEPRKDSSDSVLRALMRGQTEHLERVQCVSDVAEDTDGDLDEHEREVVARALATPDVFLLRGSSGTGKCRLAAEIARRAAKTGERVLVTALRSSTLDRVLEKVIADQGIYALRLVGPGESIDGLPPVIRALTLAERDNHCISFARERAETDIDAQRKRADCLRKIEPVWEDLLQLGEAIEPLTTRMEEIDRAIAATAHEVEQEAAAWESQTSTPTPFTASYGSFLASCRESQTQLQGALSAVERELQRNEQQLAEYTLRRDAIVRLIDARRSWQVWRWDWWAALLHPRLASRLGKHENEIRTAQSASDEIREKVRRLTEELEHSQQHQQAEQGARLATEVARRLKELEDAKGDLRQEVRDLETRWFAACQKLEPTVARPTACCRDAVVAAKDLWKIQVETAECGAQFSGRWAQWLEGTRSLPHWEYANVVGALMSTLCGSPSSLDHEASSCDLLIVLEAEQASEAELFRMTARAHRWVLVGEPASEGDRPHLNGPPDVQSVSAGAATHASSLSFSATRFHRLWRVLEPDLRRLPYRWTLERGRLRCRFQDVPPERRPWLQLEKVADCPEVELHILAPPDALSSLAEIVFPAEFSLSQAKAYVYRELQELALVPAWPNVSWAEGANEAVARLGEVPISDVLRCPLEPGVTECVAAMAATSRDGSGTAWQTVSLEFSRAAGWDRRRAEAWLNRHLDVRDLGRTAHLDVTRRMHPDLAAFVSRLLSRKANGSDATPPHSAEHSAEANGRIPHVEFVAVPPFPRQEESNHRHVRDRTRRSAAQTGSAQALPTSGAGLEVCLNDPRHRQRLPPQLALRCANGFANYAEAQAVVHTLETLADAPATACTCREPRSKHDCVGVVALYPGQVELIRTLVEQSQKLTHGKLPVQFGTPEDFRDRECGVLILSLTRSHLHRAVTFGDDPRMLELALTRGRSRLIIFGDAGTLARRSAWSGSLDHLDASAAEREHMLITRLVEYMRSPGCRSQTAQEPRSGTP
jgi:AAA domain